MVALMKTPVKAGEMKVPIFSLGGARRDMIGGQLSLETNCSVRQEEDQNVSVWQDANERSNVVPKVAKRLIRILII